jgi:hypothetical protein
MASYESLNFFDQDALQNESSHRFSTRILLDREFWVNNLSDRFYMAFNFTFVIAIILIIFLFFFIALVIPNFCRTGEFRPAYPLLPIFLITVLTIAFLGANMKSLLTERGVKMVDIQNSILLNNDIAYTKFLVRWRWAFCFFSLTLSSFFWPSMLFAVVGSFIIYLVSQKWGEKNEKFVTINGFRIV